VSVVDPCEQGIVRALAAHVLQSEHIVAPTIDEYFPMGQAKQDVASLTDEYFPLVQAKQDVDDAK
jgi:hypothetical protein